MSTPVVPSLWRGRLVALVGVVLLAFSLRSAVASLAPVLDHIARDIALSPVIIGLIGTLPPVCYALSGIFAPALERRFGLRRLAAIVLVLITVGLVGRGLASSAVLLLMATAVVFAGVGIGNVLLPPLVKRYFPDRLGTITSLYAATMSVSTFLPPLVAVPVADASSWRVSLAMWAVFGLAALIPWITLILRDGRRNAVVAERPTGSSFGRMWRAPVAWALVGAFTVSGAIAYASFTWLPSILTDVAGVSHSEAGALLSLFAAIGFPCSLIVPLVSTRPRGIAWLFVIAVATGIAGITGLVFAPAAAPAIWVILLGTAPLLFPLVLALLSQRARTHETSIALSGFVQSVGYAFVALVPVSVGLLHDATGGWTASLWLLGAIVLVAIPAGIVLARGETVEAEWERRRGAW